jgi:hypothetical protein
MSKIAIGESIRARLEPHNDSMQFAQRANTGMVDVIIDDVGCKSQVEGSIDTMCEGDQVPCCTESS